MIINLILFGLLGQLQVDAELVELLQVLSILQVGVYLFCEFQAVVEVAAVLDEVVQGRQTVDNLVDLDEILDFPVKGILLLEILAESRDLDVQIAYLGQELLPQERADIRVLVEIVDQIQPLIDCVQVTERLLQPLLQLPPADNGLAEVDLLVNGGRRFGPDYRAWLRLLGEKLERVHGGLVYLDERVQLVLLKSEFLVILRMPLAQIQLEQRVELHVLDDPGQHLDRFIDRRVLHVETEILLQIHTHNLLARIDAVRELLLRSAESNAELASLAA